jgi:hypothetical protein
MKKRGYKPKIFPMKNFRGQIWVETVVYTLIAFLMMGLVLSYAKPKIEQIQDKAALDQSVEMLKEIDSIITSIKDVSGNKRELGLVFKKGNIQFDGEGDIVSFDMESRYAYTEPGREVKDGTLTIFTVEKGKYNQVNISRVYSPDFNITVNGIDAKKTITRSASSYSVTISNKGTYNGKTIIDITVN